MSINSYKTKLTVVTKYYSFGKLKWMIFSAIPNWFNKDIMLKRWNREARYNNKVICKIDSHKFSNLLIDKSK